jgi:putative membrane protein
MLRLILHFVINVILILVLPSILPGISSGTVLGASMFVIVLTLLNSLVVPIIKIFTFPVNLLTLGLANFVLTLIVTSVAANLTNGIIIRGEGLNYIFYLALFTIVYGFAAGLINNFTDK